MLVNQYKNKNFDPYVANLHATLLSLPLEIQLERKQCNGRVACYFRPTKSKICQFKLLQITIMHRHHFSWNRFDLKIVHCKSSPFCKYQYIISTYWYKLYNLQWTSVCLKSTNCCNVLTWSQITCYLKHLHITDMDQYPVAFNKTN